MLLAHFMRAAASRTFWTAGSSRPMRIAMIAITTSSSISVKPRLRTDFLVNIRGSSKDEKIDDEQPRSTQDVRLRPGSLACPGGQAVLALSGTAAMPGQARNHRRTAWNPSGYDKLDA